MIADRLLAELPLPRQVRFSRTAIWARRSAWAAMVLLVAGGLLVAFSHYGTLDALRTRGVETMGTVVRKHGTTGRSGSLSLFFEFTVNGRTYEGKKRVSLQAYDDAEIGAPIPVTYLPSDPKTFRYGIVTQDAIDAFLLFVLVTGSVALLVSAGALMLLEWHIRRQLHIAQFWPAVSAKVVSVIPKDGKSFNVRFQYEWNGRTLKESLRMGDFEGKRFQSIKSAIIVLDPQKPRNIFLAANLKYTELTDIPVEFKRRYTSDMSFNSTERFSSRVENYVKYRPSYPPEAIQLLEQECGLKRGAAVADVGSGTGILTRLLLETGATVYAIEPNDAMRSAAEGLLANSPGFRSVAGTAEATELDGHSIDLVVAAQAFHWFDPVATRVEFQRILRPGGQVVLIWNDRHIDTTPFLRAYEEVLSKYGTDYHAVKHIHSHPGDHSEFYGPGGFTKATFPNVQHFDWDGLLGRALSSSYVPQHDHPDHAAMVEALRRVYDEFSEGGTVRFDYTTEVYYGPLT